MTTLSCVIDCQSCINCCLDFVPLTRLKEAGKLLLAGPLVDGSMGLLVFTTDSLEEALALSKDDPTVVRGVQTPNIKQWRVNIY